MKKHDRTKPHPKTSNHLDQAKLTWHFAHLISRDKHASPGTRRKAEKIMLMAHQLLDDYGEELRTRQRYDRTPPTPK